MTRTAKVKSSLSRAEAIFSELVDRIEKTLVGQGN